MKTEKVIAPLQQLQFKNKGIISRDMELAPVAKRHFYLETETEWNRGIWGENKSKTFDYMFEMKDGKPVDPPCGIRSAVPLGGLGAGTIELRGDGRLMDWNIFNNSPASREKKVQLDEAVMGLRIAAEETTTRCLRTHPPVGLPAIEEIEYAGAFPVSRLKLRDSELPVKTSLYAFSKYVIRQAEKCASPDILFCLEVTNPQDKPVDVSFMFSIPNHIQGSYSGKDQLIVTKEGQESTSGNMALTASGADSISTASGKSLKEIWEKFEENGSYPDDLSDEGKHGSICAKATIAPGETRLITIVLSWYFPNRKHGQEIIGNHYTNLFKNATDVAEQAIANLEETLKDIVEWQTVCFENSMPEWLQDSLLNSLATMYKTGIWAKDGRFRQWESFSCAGLEPLHIHQYRSLPYELFFPELKKSIYRGFAKNNQDEDGHIIEHLGVNHTDEQNLNLDTPIGRYMGDCTSGFIIGVYSSYLWNTDQAFLDEMWPLVKRAAQWQIERSKRLGLPDLLNTTYDLSRFNEKDIVAYSGFMHIAAMLAAAKLAEAKGESDLVPIYQENIATSQKTVTEKLWTGEFFRTWWMEKEEYPDAMHVDTLYGQLWAFLLGLGETIDPEKMLSHLRMEKELNDTPFGLQVIRVPGREFDIDNPINDDTTWEAGTYDWCSLNMFLGNDAEASLALAQKVADKWRLKLADQWDYKDLATIWDGYPWCNSHYTRQLITWAIPMALLGQEFSCADGTLSLNPKATAPYALPFYTPQACGILESDGENMKLVVNSGTLKLKELKINGNIVSENLNLEKGQEKVF